MFGIREIPVDGYTTIDVSLGYTWKDFCTLLWNYPILPTGFKLYLTRKYSVNPIAPRQI